MFDNLINLIKQNADQPIVKNSAIPNERNDEAVQEAGNSIMTTLQNALSGGNIKDVMKIFSGDSNKAVDNPLTQQATGSFIDTLKSKFGLDNSQAAGVADKLMPNVMNQLSQKTADPKDNSFNVQDIFNKLSGGKTSGMDVQGMFNKYTRKLDMDHDGDVDLQDLKGLFSGGGGSVIDKVKGMFN
jgi:hypothetical protein